MSPLVSEKLLIFMWHTEKYSFLVSDLFKYNARFKNQNKHTNKQKKNQKPQLLFQTML